MFGATFALALIIAINIAAWEFHWGFGLAVSAVSTVSFYTAIMDSLGRHLDGHRRDCLCRRCWPSGHQEALE